MKLAYLFECHLTDGTVIHQSPEDVSQINLSRSAFFDVAQRLDDVQVFGLYNDEHTYAVDLRDGHFEIDGVPFNIHTALIELLPEQKLELVYFRRHVHISTQGQVMSEDQSHTIEYFFGWKTTIDEKEVTQTISVK